PLLPALISSHDARMEDDPDFVYIRAQIARAVENRERNRLPLNEAALRAEREAEQQWNLEQENARRLAKGQEPLASLEDDDEDALSLGLDGTADEPESAQDDDAEADP